MAEAIEKCLLEHEDEATSRGSREEGIKKGRKCDYAEGVDCATLRNVKSAASASRGIDIQPVPMESTLYNRLVFNISLTVPESIGKGPIKALGKAMLKRRCPCQRRVFQTRRKWVETKRPCDTSDPDMDTLDSITVIRTTIEIIHAHR